MSLCCASPFPPAELLQPAPTSSPSPLLAPVLLLKQPSVIPAGILEQPRGWLMDQQLRGCVTPPPALQKELAEMEVQQGSQLPISQESPVTGER